MSTQLYDDRFWNNNHFYLIKCNVRCTALPWLKTASNTRVKFKTKQVTKVVNILFTFGFMFFTFHTFVSNKCRFAKYLLEVGILLFRNSFGTITAPTGTCFVALLAVCFPVIKCTQIEISCRDHKIYRFWFYAKVKGSKRLCLSSPSLSLPPPSLSSCALPALRLK